MFGVLESGKKKKKKKKIFFSFFDIWRVTPGVEKRKDLPVRTFGHVPNILFRLFFPLFFFVLLFFLKIDWRCCWSSKWIVLSFFFFQLGNISMCCPFLIFLLASSYFFRFLLDRSETAWRRVYYICQRPILHSVSQLYPDTRNVVSRKKKKLLLVVRKKRNFLNYFGPRFYFYFGPSQKGGVPTRNKKQNLVDGVCNHIWGGIGLSTRIVFTHAGTRALILHSHTAHST